MMIVLNYLIFKYIIKRFASEFNTIFLIDAWKKLRGW